MTPQSILFCTLLTLTLSPAALAADSPQNRKDQYGDFLPEGAIARMGRDRLRVADWIRAFAFWPDDQTLAACEINGSLVFWDRSTGREKRRLRTPLSSVDGAVFVPGSTTVCLYDGKTLLLWDTATGKQVWKLAQPNARDRLTVSPDGKRLGVVQVDRKVDVLDVGTGRKVRTFETGQNDDMALAFSPDSSLLATTGAGTINLWDISTGLKRREFSSPEKFTPRTIAFSHDGKMVAASHYRDIVIFVTATGKPLTHYKDDDFTFRQELSFAADDKTLIVGKYPGKICFLDPSTGKKLFQRKMEWYQLEPWTALSHDGKVLAVTDARYDYRLIHFLDPATGKDLIPPADGHYLNVDFVAFTPDGKTLISADMYSARYWQAGGQKHFAGYYNRGAFSPDGRLFAKPDREGVTLFDMVTGKTSGQIPYKGKDVIRTVAFSADGKHLVSLHNARFTDQSETTSAGNNGLHVWDIGTKKESRTFQTEVLFKQIYDGLALTPDGTAAVAGSVVGSVVGDEDRLATRRDLDGAGELHIWSLRSGREIRTLGGHKGGITNLVFCADGRKLLSGSVDRSFRLWEMVSGQTLFTFPGSRYWEQGAGLSPDGLLIATGNGPDPSGKNADTSTICLWSAVTGKPVLQLRGHHSETLSLAFSPDGRRLASGLRNGTVLVWDVTAAFPKVEAEIRALATKDPAPLWNDLGSADAKKADRAVWSLIASGGEAVRLIKANLLPARMINAKQLQKLLAGLDADVFATRESASRELAKLGELVEPALSKELAKNPSLEVKERIERLLVAQELPSSAIQRAVRAVAVLERIGTTEARTVLRSLAEGVPHARLTREANAAIERLKAR